jgi:aminoglycoside phosphotransferase (APT) family kinase protein
MLVPRSAEELTPRWLNAALNRNDITAVDIQDAGGSRGFAGAVLRLRPTYETTSGPRPSSLVAKLPGVTRFDPALASGAYVAYATEVEWYAEVRERCPVRTPRPYWLGAEPEMGRFCLLLEDLGALEEADHIDGASDEQARLAVPALARLHAAHWSGTDALPARFADLEATARRAKSAATAVAFGWDHFIEPFRELLPADFPDARSRLERGLGELATSLRGAPTLIHGDYKVENLLFDADGAEDPVAIIDWQAASCGAGAEDLARFLGTSVATPRRRDLEEELLDLYLRTLAEHGVDLALDDLRHDYRAALLIELGRTIGGVRHTVEGTFAADDPARQRAIEEQMRSGLERRVAAVLDSDALKLPEAG